MSPTPSIPISLPPGKDPPPTSPSQPSRTEDEAFRALSTSPTPTPTPTPPFPNPSNAKPQDPDSKAMPPPVLPRPRIPPRAPSTSKILSYSRPGFSSTQAASAAAAAAAAPSLEGEAETPQKPRPNFSPIFTLINDVTGGEQSTHHPSRIHYVFSDDDESDTLSAACVRSSRDGAASAAASRESLVQSMSMSVTDARHSSASSSSSAAFRKEEGRGRERVKREERIVVVDLSENGDAITSVNCLSAGWQVLSAELSSAPTWDTAANDPTASASQHEDKGLMLRIEGLGINTQDALGLGIGEGREGNGKDCGVIGDEEMTTLLEGFDRKMGVLRKIVTQQQQQAQGQLKRESWESPGLGEKAEGEV